MVALGLTALVSIIAALEAIVALAGGDDTPATRAAATPAPGVHARLPRGRPRRRADARGREGRRVREVHARRSASRWN